MRRVVKKTYKVFQDRIKKKQQNVMAMFLSFKIMKYMSKMMK